MTDKQICGTCGYSSDDESQNRCLTHCSICGQPPGFQCREHFQEETRKLRADLDRVTKERDEARLALDMSERPPFTRRRLEAERDKLRAELAIAREALLNICKNHGGRLVAGDECECRDVQIARGALAKIGEGKPPSPGERSKGGEG